MLKNNDPKLADMIAREKTRQLEEVELIASENYVTADVLEANGSILTNKYSEWYPWKRYYAGNEIIDEVETLAIERAKQLFDAEYANVQPLSGSPANLAVYLGLLKPWDTVLGLSLDQWGHLTHGHPLNFSWILYDIVPYTLDKETELVDMDEVEKLALEHKPQMILAWFSAYSRSLDWKRFREIADKVGAILFADIAHIAGLVAGKAIENPVPYCDVVTTTTHKTLRGPRWALILAKEKYGAQLNRAVFPWVQGWPHEHIIAAKAVAFWEALKPEFTGYAQKVIDNARILASELQKYGFRICSGWTDNHSMLIDVFGSKGLSWKEAENALQAVWLSTNKNMIPYDTRKPMDPSGIRLWTPAATTRGFWEEEMKFIARVFAEAIENREDETKLKELREEVRQLCRKFPVYKD